MNQTVNHLRNYNKLKRKVQKQFDLLDDFWRKGKIGTRSEWSANYLRFARIILSADQLEEIYQQNNKLIIQYI